MVGDCFWAQGCILSGLLFVSWVWDLCGKNAREGRPIIRLQGAYGFFSPRGKADMFALYGAWLRFLLVAGIPGRELFSGEGTG